MPFNAEQPSYKRLREHYAERRRPIVFWVGAGLSADAGLPLWPQLRKDLIAQSLETIATLEPSAARTAEARLEEAAQKDSLWDAFQIIKSVIGPTEYKETIKSIFNKPITSAVPAIYSSLWGLTNIRGILSLNIDGFVRRSHSSVRTEQEIVEFTGRDAREYISTIAAGRPFIGNLHGLRDKPSSWVFTRDEISSLTNDVAYKQFISYVFSAMTVVFVGISANDLAAGGFLERLTADGLDVGPHFWISDRADLGTHDWSARAGIQMIRYRPATDEKKRLDHTAALVELFSSIHSYESRDFGAKAVIPRADLNYEIVSPKELRSRDDDDIRIALASQAKLILQRNNDDPNSDEYVNFLKNYSSNIHSSWHITSEEPDNHFFRYDVVDKISSSSFSSIWRLADEHGKYYALKIIQIDNLRAGAQIESFRRGVQSLRYLTNAAVPGAPRLVDAFEMPTSVIMDYIEGENLADIVRIKDYFFWSAGISTIINVCRHLEYSHNLPQGVLHRDVRPSNIMIPNYHVSDIDAIDMNVDRFEVALLNYDMSWHVNAKGQTIAGKIDESGFYAPELLDNSLSSIARRTSVDVYGVGMTVFFAYTKISPPSGGSKSTDWKDLLQSKFRSDISVNWKSAPRRLQRIVESATRAQEGDRIDLSAVRAQLVMLRFAVQGKLQEITVDMWAEELLYQSGVNDYEVGEDTTIFYKTLRAGRTIALKGNFSKRVVELRFTNMALDGTDRTRAYKSWGDKLKSAHQILESHGWTITSPTSGKILDIVLTASLPADAIAKNLSRCAAGLNQGLAQVRLD